MDFPTVAPAPTGSATAPCESCLPTALTKPVVGWLEWISLAELPGHPIEAKVDTGAQTSALDACDIGTFSRDGQLWASFTVRLGDGNTATVQAPVVDTRTVRSSNGETQERVVVRLHLTLLGVEHAVEVTLTARPAMKYRMLLGRELLSRGYVVDTSRSHIGGGPTPAP